MTFFDDITGVILVGGKSRRMGRDKAFLTLDGKPFFQRVLDLFGENFRQNLLVGNQGERFAAYGLHVHKDIYPGSSLGGLYTGLYLAETKYIFVSSCDIPFPSTAVLRYLCSLREGFDVVVPVTEYGYEPLFAVYSKSCLDRIQTALECGEYCAFGYYPDLVVREVSTAEIAELNADSRCFTNINTPEEYTEIGGEPW